MPLGSESSSVQRPFVRYAVAAGWTYLLPDDVPRALFTSLLHHRLTARLRLPEFAKGTWQNEH